MSRPESAILTAALVALAGVRMLGAQTVDDEIGRTATAAEIAAWDQWVTPDGEGLPPGRGTAGEGEPLYAQLCSTCHGPDGRGGEQAALVGGRGTLASADPVKTVESYWPYATTLWDYIHRAMPFDLPGTLTADQVYSLVAYVLYLGDVVERDEVMDAESLPEVQMPNRDGFIPDPRPDVGAPSPLREAP